MDMFVIEMLVVTINSLKLAHKDDKFLGECQAITVTVEAVHCGTSTRAL